MPYAPDRAASRFSRDRDLLPAVPRPGPYELRYDVRRGYDGPPARLSEPRDHGAADVLLLRAREDEDPPQG